jgi:ATPases involved in chromosome partitioning
MARKISVANQKGGVGKTTTTINLGACLTDLGQKVLIVDVDPQGNATSGLGIKKANVEKDIYDVLVNEYPLKKRLFIQNMRTWISFPQPFNLLERKWN